MFYSLRFAACLVVGVTSFPSLLLGIDPPQANSAIVVQYLQDQPQTLELEELRKLPLRRVKVKDRDGQEATYDGVYLHDLLELTPAPIGESLRGAAMGLFLVAEAQDGYRVLFSLPETDPEFSGNIILVAYAKNDKPLDGKEGPLRLIVPSDKRHARWIRMLAKIYILDSVPMIKKKT
jgi:hypothetical protein